MSDAAVRGAAIKRRRLALGITSLRQFEEAMGGRPGRDTLGKVEDGLASGRTLDSVEAWLTSQDAGAPAPVVLVGTVEDALEVSGLDVWRQHAVLAEYHRHLHEQEREGRRA